jgi:hypothetical protein
MLKSIIESFLDLDIEDKNEIIDLVNSFIFPIKVYLILIVLLLFTLVCIQIYLYS